MIHGRSCCLLEQLFKVEANGVLNAAASVLVDTLPDAFSQCVSPGLECGILLLQFVDASAECFEIVQVGEPHPLYFLSCLPCLPGQHFSPDRKSTRLNSSHGYIS